jgi:hypothetical protein
VRATRAFPRQARAVPVFALLLILVASILPEAESPLPDRIGLLDVITWAGAGGVLGGLICFKSTAAKRDLAIRWGGLIGFLGILALYLLALLVQVISTRR